MYSNFDYIKIDLQYYFFNIRGEGNVILASLRGGE